MSSPFAQTLVDAHAGIAPTLPGGRLAWLTRARHELLAQFAAADLPGAREEAWKYTALKPLAGRRMAPLAAPTLDAATEAALAARIALPDCDGPRLVFVNGCWHAGLSRLVASEPAIRVERLAAALDAGADGLCVLYTPGQPVRDRFDALNAAFAADGVVIRVAPGARIERPVQIVCAQVDAAGEGFWALRQRIAIGAGARVNVIEQHIALGSARHVGSLSLLADLEADARLSMLRLTEAGDRATLIADSRYRLAESATLSMRALDFGAAPSRHALDIDLAGRSASVELGHAFVLSGRRHADLQLRVLHQGRDTRSDIITRGVADQRSRGVFRGALVVASGADGSDAALSSKNLLLSADAEIDTQPVLEIDADEVKAAHGATVGQLDPTALFYLRSRGIPKDAARNLLTQAFCREALVGAWPAALDARLEGLIAAALPDVTQDATQPQGGAR